MADLKKRLPANVAGEFYVDSTCIDCDACRQIATSVFSQQNGYSAVTHQPSDAVQLRDAQRTLLACPTGSIGTVTKNGIGEVISDFPLRLEENVYYCGFNSPKSFGGNSYFVQHDQANWLIDSPRYAQPLVSALEKSGGVQFIFLSHRDDVADAAKFAAHFKSQRIIHEYEAHSQPGAEIVLNGLEPVAITPEFLVIPTPGHTRGHCCLLYSNRYLFTGDHLDWNRDSQRLDASRDYCWYSWPQQIESMSRLLKYSFEWVLPGHGQRVRLESADMKSQLEALVRTIHRDER
jgi:glyoxylase-like metal-dependent hydrolase (beta-lactamase superfamily II)/ferredoxin